MQAKIIYLYQEDNKRKQTPLSPLMITSLLEACKLQEASVAFGPVDIKGSFGALLARGLIIRRAVSKVGHPHDDQWRWSVTNKALELLREQGFDILC